MDDNEIDKERCALLMDRDVLLEKIGIMRRSQERVLVDLRDAQIRALEFRDGAKLASGLLKERDDARAERDAAVQGLRDLVKQRDEARADAEKSRIRGPRRKQARMWVALAFFVGFLGASAIAWGTRRTTDSFPWMSTEGRSR